MCNVGFRGFCLVSLNNKALSFRHQIHFRSRCEHRETYLSNHPATDRMELEGRSLSELVQVILPQFPGAESKLVVFRRQYLQRIEVKRLHFPPSQLLASYDVQQWIWLFVYDMHEKCSWHQYEEMFLKTLIEKMDDAVTDAIEPVRP